MNPFGAKKEPARQPKLSGWERLPKPYRDACEQLAKRWKCSPQNKQVRQAIDKSYATRRMEEQQQYRERLKAGK